MSAGNDPGLSRLAASTVVTGFGGTDAPDWLLRQLEEGLGGVCWFAHNVGDPDRATALAARLHAVREGVVVMSDEEGGDVARLEAATGSSWPSHAALGVVDDATATRQVATQLGHQLRAVGIDIALAPVVDVNSEAENPVIGVRSFGRTPDLVARHGAAFVEGLQSAGVAACAKHFPGHGSTVVDSHLGLPVVEDSEEVWRDRDLAPFAAVVDAGVRSVMTAHVVFAAMDDKPATLSPRLLGLLRGELGFDGVIVSDALDMKAISAGVGHGEGAVQTVAAGTDLICIGNPDHPELYNAEDRLTVVVDALVAAVQAGRLDAQRLEEAAARVDALASWTATQRVETVGTADVSIGAAVARRAVQRRGDVAVRAPRVIDLAGGFSIAAGARDRHLCAALLRRDAGIDTVDVDGADELAKALTDSAGRDVVVLARTPHDPATKALLDHVVTARPDAVIVQTGLADPSGAGKRVVWTHGGGRAVAEAAADLLLPGAAS
jgi:beta-N-acetylhexosaminidase